MKQGIPNIGTRRELFVDRLLIDDLSEVEHVLNTPAAACCDEGELPGGYVTILQDDTGYKRYYRSWFGTDSYDGHPGEVTCLDVSKDGIRWTQPDLGLYNIPSGITHAVLAHDPPRNHNFSPFIDQNPKAEIHQRYKALSGTHKDDGGRPADVPPLDDNDSGLYAFCSSDGIHWEKMQDHPVITFPEYAFDSQNISFWSTEENQYVCYFRCWEPDMRTAENGVLPEKVTSATHLRSIARTTSKDFRHWTEPVRMNPNFPDEHLYTSQIHPYFRAPHMYIALPTRFMPLRGSSTDILFMSSRSGSVSFDRTFTKAFVKPGPDERAWGNRSNYASLNTYQTSDTEMSFYVRGIRRVLRIDGFASLSASGKKGYVITKPFIFSGNQLSMNFATSAAGSIAVTLTDAEGRPLSEHGDISSCEAVGDSINGEIRFPDSCRIGTYAGTPVRMKISIHDADVYSFRFH